MGGGRWEVGGVGVVGVVGGAMVGNTSHGNVQVRFDRFDRRPDSMPVFAVGWLGM